MISLDERKVVGWCEGRVYYFSLMTAFFDPEYIVEGLDDEDADCGALGAELLKRRSLRFLLDWRAQADMLHPMKLGVAHLHRGKALGLKLLGEVIRHASGSLDCDYAVLYPEPIKFEDEDAEIFASKEKTDEMRWKLFGCYARLGFVRPSSRSEFLYRRIAPES